MRNMCNEKVFFIFFEKGLDNYKRKVYNCTNITNTVCMEVI
jgi:hypothetical protein